MNKNDRFMKQFQEFHQRFFFTCFNGLYFYCWHLWNLIKYLLHHICTHHSWVWPCLLVIRTFFLLLQMATCILFYLCLLLLIPFMDFVAPLMYLKQQGTIKAKGKYSIFNEIIQREYPLIFEPNCWSNST